MLLFGIGHLTSVQSKVMQQLVKVAKRIRHAPRHAPFNNNNNYYYDNLYGAVTRPYRYKGASQATNSLFLLSERIYRVA